MKHFWFSLEQADVRERNGYPRVFAKIDGKEVEYTCCSETETHGCHFQDMTYLGEGAFSRCESAHPSTFSRRSYERSQYM